MEPSKRRPPSTVWQLPLTLKLALPAMKPFEITKKDQYWLGDSGGIAVNLNLKKNLVVQSLTTEFSTSEDFS